MRILHVIPFLWSGAGSVVTRLCETQSRSHKVAIVTSGESKGLADWPDYRVRLQSGGIRHFPIDLFDRDPAVFWHSVENLARTIRRWRADVVHTHAGVPACAAALAPRKFVFIAQLHSWGVGRPDWMNVMDAGGFRQADRVLCSSRAYRKTLQGAGVRNVTYLPWGIAPNSQRYTGMSCTAPGFRVGFAGRLEPRKCQLDLVRAFFKFRKRHPESTLELIGPAADDAYVHEIALFIEKSGLQQAVSLTGHVADPNAHMSKWNLFTSLSSDEGQGLAILEAMSLGVPVLARCAAGVEDYLRDGKTGIAVRSSSPAEVAERLEWAFHSQDELKKIAARARRMVVQHYDWNAMLRRMEDIYTGV